MTNCPACSSVIADSRISEPHIAFCDHCGTGITVPAPSRDVQGDGLFEDESAGYGGDRLGQRDQWLLEANRRLSWIEKSCPATTSILEIGAATGEFVAAAEAAGHPVVGLETSPWAAGTAKELTSRVELADLDTWVAAHPGKRFDVIAMFHVLEHVAVPAVFLSSLLTAANPGAHLFVEVPNGGSAAARADGIGWWAARPADHFFHYSPDGARLLLEAAGWHVADVRAVGVDIYWQGARAPLVTAAKDLVRPVFGKPPRPRDLLRVVAAVR